ncbi:MAG: FecCD family ABC transporter permease [Arachnia sp.]
MNPPTTHDAPPLTKSELASLRRARLITATLVPIAIIALLVSIVAGIALGASDLGMPEIVRSVLARFGFDVVAPTSLQDAVIWKLRAPRVLLAAVVGAGLAVCGAVLQALTRNPLADPYLLGVSSGASAGAVTILILGVGGGAISLNAGALAGALAAFAIVLLLAGRQNGGTSRIVLAGIAVGQFFAALTSLVVMSSADNDSARTAMGWLLGSLAGASWELLGAAAIVAALGIVVIWVSADTLDAFTFGRETAASLGVAPGRAATALFVLTAVMTAVLVAASGAIGFVGLIIPHLARLLGARRHRALVPWSALLGALFLVWADVVSRVAFAPQQIPVGVVTALVGVPVFAVILTSRRREAA